MNFTNVSNYEWDMPEYLPVINRILGKYIVPLFTSLSLLCNFFTVLAVYLFGIDRAPLLFVVLVSLSQLATSTFTGLFLVRLE